MRISDWSSDVCSSDLNTGSPVNTSTTPTGSLPLEGLSKHNVNATAFYEKGPISLRVAYNWRSRFLLTAADVIFPYTSTFNDATGKLDASLSFNLTKNLKKTENHRDGKEWVIKCRYR